jgi:serine/threonine protein kinase
MDQGLHEERCLAEQTHRSEGARRLDLSIRDFELLRVLGEGSLSTVILARRKATGTEHALKVIDKYYITRHNMTDAVIRERHVMDALDSDWVVRLHFTFQVRCCSRACARTRARGAMARGTLCTVARAARAPFTHCSCNYSLS